MEECNVKASLRFTCFLGLSDFLEIIKEGENVGGNAIVRNME